MKIRLSISIILLLTVSAWSQAGADASTEKPTAEADVAQKPVEGKPEDVVPDKPVPERDHRAVTRGAAGMEQSSNVLNAGFSLRSAVDTNASGMAGAIGTDLFSTLVGNLRLNRERRNYTLGLSYSGGGEIFARNSDFNAPFQHMGASIELRRRNLIFALREELDFSPNSQTAMRREVPADAISGSVTGLGPNDVPNQSILGARARQLNNTSAAQLDYALAGKNIFSLSGSYGTLRFVDNDLLDNQQANVSLGYVRAITPRFKVGAFYSYALYRYGPPNPTVYTKSALAYVSRQFGRLTLQASAGPQFSQSDLVHNANVVSIDGSGSFVLGTSILTFGAFRGTSGGSGILASSVTTSYSAGYSRSLSRQWSMTSSATYSTSKATATAAVVQSAFARSSFVSKTASVEVGRTLSRGKRAYVRYSAQQGGRSVCASAGCSFDGIRHIVELGLSWDLRPIRIK